MKNELLINAINNFQNIKALVIGDVMLDVYEYLLTSESKPLHSEKPDKRAYKSQKAVRTLGGAGNAAANLASLEVKTTIVGITGNDEYYFVLRDMCDKSGISHILIRDSKRPTTIKNRLYLDDQYLLRRDDESTEKIDNETASTLLREILTVIPKVDVVILSDYNKGIFTERLSQDIINECKLHSVPVIVDFKPANASFFKGADLIAPNLNEAKELQPDFSIKDLETGLNKIYEQLQCKAVAVTLDENGIAGFNGKDYFHVHGHKVQAMDAVGCGDTVRVGFALGVSSGLSIEGAAELANYMAAVIVQKPNTSSITIEELIAFIGERSAINNYIKIL